jgi:glycosyltransferase involved in cell wall biosynthesis
MKLPDVSIVVPIYNGAKYLRETLDSLLSQSFRNFELLAIDDGSKDDSAEIVRSLGDPRVRLIQKPNGGLCDALNCGIAEAKTPFLARNDQDDLSLPTRLERQLQTMHENPDAIALLTFNSKFGGRRSWANTDKLQMSSGTVRPYKAMEDGCLLGSTMLARVEALRSIGGFRQAYYPVDDWDLECRLSQAGQVLVLCEPLTAYRFQADANTYRVFSEMQTKTRWTADSYYRRMRAEPELTFEQFVRQEDRSRWTRFSHDRSEAAKWNMRTAGQFYLDGRYAVAARRLSAACLLDPADMVKRVWRMAAAKTR